MVISRYLGRLGLFLAIVGIRSGTGLDFVLQHTTNIIKNHFST